MTYNRIEQWDRFSEQVRRHIVQYTLEQYGNPEGDEQVEEFTAEDCWKQIMRYTNRRNSCTRGKTEQMRDVIKVAHYAQFIYAKLKEAWSLWDVYPAYEPVDGDVA
jgi:hypothetical protein